MVTETEQKFETVAFEATDEFREFATRLATATASGDANALMQVATELAAAKKAYDKLDQAAIARKVKFEADTAEYNRVMGPINALCEPMVAQFRKDIGRISPVLVAYGQTNFISTIERRPEDPEQVEKWVLKANGLDSESPTYSGRAFGKGLPKEPTMGRGGPRKPRDPNAPKREGGTRGKVAVVNGDQQLGRVDFAKQVMGEADPNLNGLSARIDKWLANNPQAGWVKTTVSE